MSTLTSLRLTSELLCQSRLTGNNKRPLNMNIITTLCESDCLFVTAVSMTACLSTPSSEIWAQSEEKSTQLQFNIRKVSTKNNPLNSTNNKFLLKIIFSSQPFPRILHAVTFSIPLTGLSYKMTQDILKLFIYIISANTQKSIKGKCKIEELNVREIKQLCPSASVDK